jgi:hypothetical protein
MRVRCDLPHTSVGYFSCAIQAGTGAVVCWGYDSIAELTPPDSVNGTAATASAIAAGGGYTLAIQATPEPGICFANGTALVVLALMSHRARRPDPRADSNHPRSSVVSA